MPELTRTLLNKYRKAPALQDVRLWDTQLPGAFLVRVRKGTTVVRFYVLRGFGCIPWASCWDMPRPRQRSAMRISADEPLRQAVAEVGARLSRLEAKGKRMVC